MSRGKHKVSMPGVISFALKQGRDGCILSWLATIPNGETSAAVRQILSVYARHVANRDNKQQKETEILEAFSTDGDPAKQKKPSAVNILADHPVKEPDPNHGLAIPGFGSVGRPVSELLDMDREFS